MLLDVRQRLVVIIGGGAVASRKARGLLVAGAKRIRCVALNFDQSMPPQVQRVSQAFQPEHLDGAGLVFAATDSPEVNDAVVREAHCRGLLVNRADADEDQPGDFTTPAIWQTDSLLLAASADGNPALAARIRDDLAAKIDPLLVRMAAAMQQLRPIVRARVADIARRRQIFRELSGAEAMTALAQDGIEGLGRWLETMMASRNQGPQ